MDYSSSDVKKLHTVAMAQMREKKKIVEKLLLTDKAKEYYHRTKALEAFKTIFYEAVSDDVLSDFEIQYLKHFAKRNNLEWETAVSFVSAEAGAFIESIIQTYSNDGLLDQREQDDVSRLSKIFHVNLEDVSTYEQSLSDTKRKAIGLFKNKFKEFVSDGVLTKTEIAYLKRLAKTYALDWKHMMTLIRSDALIFVKSLVKTAAADDILNDKEELIIRKAMDLLHFEKEERYYIEYDLLNIKAKALEMFADTFLDKISQDEFDEENLKALKEVAESYSLSWKEAVESVQDEAREFIKKLIVFAKQDGELDKKEENTIKRVVRLFNMPDDVKNDFYSEIKTIKQLQNIREGDLPGINDVPVMLESTELAHSSEKCHFKKTPGQQSSLYGTMVITNSKVYFIGTKKSFKFTLKSVFNLSYDGEHIFIDRQGTGRGHYRVKEPEITFELLLYLVRKNNFLVAHKNERERSRHIPQDVKVAVYHRDGGRCVICNSDVGLEFDHIIPFSKGGANTAENIQLLCHVCNLKKGAHL
ncbi:MAG: TerB family tellurite resistance protein [Deltaproteobacteria bacterium]|nr:TerB family tellurite resistance protein [Candidatus Zymogenaceae bacterium]